MDPKRVEAIYDELGTLLVELAPDPASKGPGYLQELISRTRGYLNRTSVLIQEAHKHKHLLERDLEGKKTVFQLRSDELLADDARVTKLPNIDDRKAMTNLILKDERQEISVLEHLVRETGYVEKAVKHRHKELDNTISAIRMQKSLIDSESRTGSFYGDETNTSRGDVYGGKAKTPQPDDDISEEEISKLLAESLEGISSDASNSSLSEDDFLGTVLKCAESPNTPQHNGVTVDSDPKEADEFSKFLDNDEFADIFDGV